MTRYTLKTLIATVTLAGIGCAALAKPTEMWASVVFSGTLLVLFGAIVVAFSRRGALPFVIFGWGYLLLILWPGANKTVLPHLITSKGLVELETWWHPGLTLGPPGPSGPFVSPLPFGVFATWTSAFQRIGHCLFALLFAALAAMVAGWLGRREREGAAG